MRIFITRALLDKTTTLLQHAGHTVTTSPLDRDLTAAELLEAARAADALVTMLTNKIDDAFLAARPNIRAIANYAVGTNNIDLAACTARGVGVSNTPGVLTDATAEVAWLLIMMAARRGGEAERLVRSHQWHGWSPMQMMGTAIAGQTLGLLGAGRIGSRVARMAQGFDMKLLYTNRHPSPAMDALGARLVPLDELLRESDVLSLHVPLSPETRHMIGPRQLALMKPTAVLVNTARGPVVDEAALAAALRSKKLFAAGLDVYENEPTIHPDLYTLENVILLPHIGSATIATRTHMAEMTARNLTAILAGQRPPNPANPDLWDLKTSTRSHGDTKDHEEFKHEGAKTRRNT